MCLHTKFLLWWDGIKFPGRLPEFGDTNAGFWRRDKTVLLRCASAQGRMFAHSCTRHRDSTEPRNLPLEHPNKTQTIHDTHYCTPQRGESLCCVCSGLQLLGWEMWNSPKGKTRGLVLPGLSSSKRGSWPSGLVSFLRIPKYNQQTHINDTKSWKSRDWLPNDFEQSWLLSHTGTFTKRLGHLVLVQRCPWYSAALTSSSNIPLPSMRNSCSSTCSSRGGEECCKIPRKHHSEQ